MRRFSLFNQITLNSNEQLASTINGFAFAFNKIIDVQQTLKRSSFRHSQSNWLNQFIQTTHLGQISKERKKAFQKRKLLLNSTWNARKSVITDSQLQTELQIFAYPPNEQRVCCQVCGWCFGEDNQQFIWQFRSISGRGKTIGFMVHFHKDQSSFNFATLLCYFEFFFKVAY